jgi:hypothetical protein
MNKPLEQASPNPALFEPEAPEAELPEVIAEQEKAEVPATEPVRPVLPDHMPAEHTETAVPRKYF